MQSHATSVEEYFAELPEDRRQALTSVRRMILGALPEGLEETMAWGMIAYVVPLETFADTYNGQPLVHTALANQKQYMSVYLNAIYADERIREEFEVAYRATGKRYDVGKSCVRFRRIDDLPLPVVAAAIESTSVEQLIAQHERAMGARRSRPRKRVP
ncbi:MAG: iron chaperone [bacterium]